MAKSLKKKCINAEDKLIIGNLHEIWHHEKYIAEALLPIINFI